MLTKYTKMNGLKNDFIVFKGPVNMTSSKVAELCNRQTGMGADGVLVVSTANESVQMEYWNADGSVAEMCGNGLRCVARFAVDNKLTDQSEFTVLTPAGQLKVIVNDSEDIEAQIGKVAIEPDPIAIDGLTFYKANVGNPHAITYVDDIENASVVTIGPIVENDQHFPNRTNVEFVEVIDDSHLRLRVWERGVGETLACGTGIVAVAILSAQLQKTKLPVTVEVRGGDAKVWVDGDGYARLKGAVETNGEGEVEL